MINLRNLSKVIGRLVACLLMVSFTIGISSCVQQDPPMVSVSKTTILAGCEAQSIPVTVMSNTDWTASSNSPWCRVSITSGKGTTEIQLILEACNVTQEREAVVEVKSKTGSASAKISVKQNALNGILLVSPKDIEIDNKGGNLTFAVSSNTNWTVSPLASWVTVDKTSGEGNGVVTVSVAANETHGVDRVGTVSVIADDGNNRLVEEFTITQLGRALPVLAVAQSEVVFAADAKTANANKAVVPFVTNVLGEVKAISDFTWCDATVENGAVVITVEDNTNNKERVAIVNVYASVEGEAVVKQIKVRQAGVGSPEVIVLKNNVVVESISKNSSDPQIPVAVPYIVTSKGATVSVEQNYPSWIVDVKLEKDANQLTFNVLPNNSSESRSAVLVLIAKLGSEIATYPITVTQQGVAECKVVLSTDQLYFGSGEGEAEVNLFVNNSQSFYTAFVSNANWATASIDVTGDSFGGNGKLKVRVSENTSSEQRSATVIVVVSVGDQLQYVPVSVLQDGIGGPEVITVSSEIVLPQAGCKEEDHQHVVLLGVDDQTTVKAIETATWLEVIVGKDYVGFVASTNESSTSRSTVVTILSSKGGEESLQTITVIQPGTGSAELLVEGTSYEYPQAGGNFKIAIKSVNGTEYKVVDQPVWVSLKAATDFDGMEINVEENLTTLARSGKIVLLSNNGDDYRYYTIAVTQLGLDAPAIELSASEIVIPRVGLEGTEGYEVSVIGADDYTTVSTKSSVPWLEGIVSAEKDAISIKAEENAKSSKREGEISVIAVRGGQEQIEVIKVIQPGTGSAELRISVDSYEFGPKEVSVFEIPVTKLNGSSYSVAAKPEWVSVVAASEGSEVLKIGLSSNESTVESREGVIILRATNGGDETQYSISIKQLGVDGPNVTLAVSTITVPIEGIDGTDGTSGYNVGIIGVDEGTTLSTRTSAPWVQGVITADKELSFVVTDNSSSSKKRTAVVSVVAAKGGEEQILSVEVVQPGTGSAALFLALTEYSFGHTAVTDFVIPVTKLNGSKYSVSAQPEWLTIKPESVGTEAIEISFTANESNEPREGYIVLRATNGDDQTQYSIYVKQLGLDGPNVKFDRESIVIPQRAITKIDEYYITMIGADANTTLTVMQDEIVGDQWFRGVVEGNKVYVEATENAKSDKRFGQLTVLAQRGEQEQILTVEVIQPGKGSAALEIPRNEYSFSYEAVALFEIPIIKLNGTSWKVDIAPEWLTVQDDNSDVLKLSLSLNDSVESREGDIVLRASNGDDQTLYIIKIKQLGTDGPNLQLSKYEITLPQKGSTAASHSIALINNDPMVTISLHSNATWVAGVLTGDVIGFNADLNPNSEKREATVTIRAERGDEYQIIPIKVVQLGTGSAELILPVTEITLGHEASTSDVEVLVTMLKGTTYTVENPASWITITSTDGEPVLTFTVTKNEVVEPRTSDIILRATNGSDVTLYTIKVTQLGIGGPNVTPVAYEVVFPALGSYPMAKELALRGVDADTQIEVKGTLAPWVKAAYSASTLKIEVQSENVQTSERTATVTLVATKGGVEQLINIKVVQLTEGQPFVVSNLYDYTLTPASRFYEIEFLYGNIARGFSDIKIVSKPAWIVDEYLHDYGDQGGSVNFDTEDNTSAEPREGSIVLSYTDGDINRLVRYNLTQLGIGGPDAVLEKDRVVLSQSSGSEEKIRVVGANSESKIIDARSNVSWLDVTTSGTAEHYRTLTVKATSPNNSVESREGVVTVVVERGGQRQYLYLTVTQLGTGSPELELVRDEINFPYTESSYNLHYIARNGANVTSVTVSTKPSWLTVSGTNPLTISATKNESVDARSGIVVLRAVNDGDAVFYNVVVNQAGIGDPNVVASTTSIVLENNTSDTRTVVLSGIDGVDTKYHSIATDYDWIEAIYDNATKIITFRAKSENIEKENREGTVQAIFVRGGKLQIIEFQVSQLGYGDAYIHVANTEYVYPAAGVTGTKIPVFADAGVTYQVVSQPSWLSTITKDESGLTFDVLENTTTEQRVDEIILKVTAGKDTYYTIGVRQLAADGPAIELSMYEVEIPQTGGSSVKTISVLPNGADWKYATSSPWITLNNTGTTVSIDAEPNTLAEERHATITFVATKNGQTQVIQVPVVQLGTGSAGLTLPITTIYVGPNEVLDYAIPAFPTKNAKITVMTDPAYDNAIVTDVEFVAADKEIVFDISKNETTKARHTVVYFKASNGGKTRTYAVEVFQASNEGPKVKVPSDKYVIAQPAPATFPDDANPIEIPFMDYDETKLVSVTATYLSGGDNWLHWNPSTLPVDLEPDPGVNKLEVSADENTLSQSRVAILAMEFERNNEKQLIIVTITQLGKGSPVLAAPSVYYFENEEANDDKLPVYVGGGSEIIAVDITDCSFLSDLKFTATEITVDVARNTTDEERSGVVYVTGKKGDETVTYPILVIQRATESIIPELVSDEYVVSVAAQTVTVPVQIKGDITYSAVDSEITYLNPGVTGWLSVDYSAYPNVTFTTTENKAAADREAVVAVTVQNEVEDQFVLVFKVTQAGVGSPQLIAPSTIYVDSKEHEVSIPLYYGEGTQFVSADLGHISFVQYQIIDAGTGAYALGIKRNDTDEDRFGVIFITVEKGGEKAVYPISIIQKANESVIPELKSNEYVIAAANGSSADILIDLKDDNNTTLVGSQITYLNPGITDWLTIEGTYPNLSVKASSKNNASASRQAVVSLTIKNEVGDQFVLLSKVTQLGQGSPVAAVSPIYYVDSEAQSDVKLPLRVANDVSLGEIDITDAPFLTSPTIVDYGTKYYKVNVLENTTGKERSGVVYLTATKGDETITYAILVIQRAAKSVLPELYSEDYTIAATGGDLSVPIAKVTSAMSLEDAKITLLSGPADWLTLKTPASTPATLVSSVVFTATENKNIAERQAVVALEVDNGIDRTVLMFNVTQLGINAPVIAVPTIKVYGSEENTSAKVPFFSNVTLNVADVVVTSDAGWITDAAYNGSDAIQMKIAANPNTDARTATLIVKVAYGGETYVYPVAVVQNGADEPAPAALYSDKYTINQAGDAINVTISNPSSLAIGTPVVTVLEGPSAWLTATATAAGVNLTASANTTTKTNRAVVALPVGEQILMFEVVQYGVDAPVVAVPSTHVIAADATSSTLPVYSDVTLATVDVKNLPTWITATTYSSGVITFTTTANTDTERRIATVFVEATYAGETYAYPVTVIQQGDDPVVPKPAALYSDKYVIGTTLDVTISNPSSLAIGTPVVTVLEGPSAWLTATATAAGVNLTASANTTTKTNRAVVALPVGEQILMFEVVQYGVDAPVVAVPSTHVIAADATSSTLPVYSDVTLATVDVKNLPTWITATTYSSGVITFTTTANTDTERRIATVFVEATYAGETYAYPVTVIQQGDDPAAPALAELYSYKYTAGGNDDFYLFIDLKNGAGKTISTPVLTYLQGNDWIELITSTGTLATDEIQFRTKLSNSTTEPRTVVVALPIDDQILMFEITQQSL